MNNGNFYNNINGNNNLININMNNNINNNKNIIYRTPFDNNNKNSEKISGLPKNSNATTNSANKIFKCFFSYKDIRKEFTVNSSNTIEDIIPSLNNEFKFDKKTSFIVNSNEIDIKKSFKSLGLSSDDCIIEIEDKID